MAVSDKAEGPVLCQPVLYNNGGAIVSGMIYAVAAGAGTVSLVYFNASGATSVTGVSYDPNLGTGKWAYPPFF